MSENKMAWWQDFLKRYQVQHHNTDQTYSYTAIPTSVIESDLAKELDRAQSRIAELEAQLAEARKDGERLLGLAQKLFDQLEFCGWGDSYERECSEKLREQACDELEKQHAAAAAAEGKKG